MDPFNCFENVSTHGIIQYKNKSNLTVPNNMPPQKNILRTPKNDPLQSLGNTSKLFH